MPPECERRNRDYDDWRRTMREVWKIEPGLTLCITQAQTLIAIAGHHPSQGYPEPVNDLVFTSSLP